MSSSLSSVGGDSESEEAVDRYCGTSASESQTAMSTDGTTSDEPLDFDNDVSSSDFEQETDSSGSNSPTVSGNLSSGYPSYDSSCSESSSSFIDEYGISSNSEDEKHPEVTDKGNSMIPGLPPELYTKIYDKADLTVIDSYVLLLQYSLRHSLTKKAFSELIQLISVHLPRSSNAAESLYKVKSLFMKMFDDIKHMPYAYCSKCHRLMDNATTCLSGCNADIEEFLHIPLGPQLKRKLEGKSISTSMDGHIVAHYIYEGIQASSEATSLAFLPLTLNRPTRLKDTL